MQSTSPVSETADHSLFPTPPRSPTGSDEHLIDDYEAPWKEIPLDARLFVEEECEMPSPNMLPAMLKLLLAPSTSTGTCDGYDGDCESIGSITPRVSPMTVQENDFSSGYEGDSESSTSLTSPSSPILSPPPLAVWNGSYCHDHY